jgi:L,D-transpeptidase ErfK/SrfK
MRVFGGGAHERRGRRLLRLGWLGFVALGAAWTGAPSGSSRAERDAPGLAAVVGQPSTDVIGEGDTLLDMALRNRVGFSAVERLNPGVDVWMPPAGTTVALPTSMILPDAPHEGLVINVPEMRLYDFTVGPVPEIFAIAIGDDVDTTPQGDFRIGAKRVDPVWHVPESIRRAHPELPARVAPGPDNPLGDRWMTIGTSSYGIHGTNIEWSIGRIATHGCIRLYTADIHALYDRVPVGTPVHLRYQTTKIGVPRP